MEKKLNEQKSSPIEVGLDSAHFHIARAGFLIVTLLIKRRLLRAYIDEARQHLNAAEQLLGELNDRTKHTRM